jgi:hypothetical protein
MTKPISDKAEVAVEYPDKLYMEPSHIPHGLTLTSIKPAYR